MSLKYCISLQFEKYGVGRFLVPTVSYFHGLSYVSWSLFQVSGRLFAEPIPRRRTHLSGDTGAGTSQQSTSANLLASGGNGSTHSSVTGSGASSRNSATNSFRSSATRRSALGLAEINADAGKFH